MNQLISLTLVVLLVTPLAALHAADLERTETLQLPECHSVRWVHAWVKLMRKKHNALWNFVVEPKTGHGPGEKTWPLVFSFLRHTFP